MSVLENNAWIQIQLFYTLYGKVRREGKKKASKHTSNNCCELCKFVLSFIQESSDLLKTKTLLQQQSW